MHFAVWIVDGVAGVHLRLPLLDLVHRRRLLHDAVGSLVHIRVVDSFSKEFTDFDVSGSQSFKRQM